MESAFAFVLSSFDVLSSVPSLSASHSIIGASGAPSALEGSIISLPSLLAPFHSHKASSNGPLYSQGLFYMQFCSDLTSIYPIAVYRWCIRTL
ncbi:hypothetical protein BDV19DRAFT_364103 [Aspergillus venezuelensis]